MYTIDKIKKNSHQQLIKDKSIVKGKQLLQNYNFLELFEKDMFIKNLKRTIYGN